MRRVRTKNATQRFGDYHIVLLTRRRRHTLGKVLGGVFTPSEYGEFVEESLLTMIRASPGLKLFEYALMPNHVHIAMGLAGVGPTVSAWVNAFESRATRRGRNAGAWTSEESPWAEGMWCERITDSQQMRVTRAYIRNNPIRWTELRSKW
jgi:putative transposase